MASTAAATPAAASAAAPAAAATEAPDWEAVLEDDTVPRGGSSALYTTKAYWDHRFEREEHHEWLAGYDAIAALVRAAVPDKGARLLLVGCGTSTLAADLVDDGYRNVVATDYSEVVVARMAAKYAASHPAIVWQVQDMRALSAADASYDVVFDKAAMDAVLAHGADVWDPPEPLLATAAAIMREAARVLVPATGVYLQLSFAQPHFRRPYLLQAPADWRGGVTKADVPVGFGYFFYTLHRA